MLQDNSSYFPTTVNRLRQIMSNQKIESFKSLQFYVKFYDERKEVANRGKN